MCVGGSPKKEIQKGEVTALSHRALSDWPGWTLVCEDREPGEGLEQVGAAARAALQEGREGAGGAHEWSQRPELRPLGF